MVLLRRILKIIENVNQVMEKYLKYYQQKIITLLVKKIDYWKELENHIIKYKDYFINGVINSMCQGTILPYKVYEYDGEKINKYFR